MKKVASSSQLVWTNSSRRNKKSSPRIRNVEATKPHLAGYGIKMRFEFKETM